MNSLAKRIAPTKEEAKEYVRKIQERFPRIKQYQELAHKIIEEKRIRIHD